MMLLDEHSAHGYELQARLQELGFPRDTGGMYRTLRSLEDEGMVRGRPKLSEAGPTQWQYHLTDAGRAWLDASVELARETIALLEVVVGRHQRAAAARAGAAEPVPPTTSAWRTTHAS